MIAEFTYKPYKTVEVVKSNSSYGNWFVRTSEVTFKYFWRKSQAIEYASTINNLNTSNSMGLK